jgi:2-polyprenyl-3-methyl-5-hydroxy-6-metoxy-1,4-benzoquinol methylase
MPEANYIELNREAWNKRTEYHVKSDFYDNESFLNGKNTLQSIELALLRDVKEKKILHLQCHFGQDSLSLSRMGAKVTGVDLSDKAIETAKKLNDQLKLDANFVVSDIYELPKNLDEKFDIVFTSYGTIGWLPDLDKWAAVIDYFLKPGGQFVFAEFHPVVWMFDNDFTKVAYNYFKSDPIVETEKGTYADKNAPVEITSVGWNHGLGEVISSLLKTGLSLEDLKEYDYSPYDCFHEAEEFSPGRFRIKHLGNQIPLVYSLLATKGS